MKQVATKEIFNKTIRMVSLYAIGFTLLLGGTFYYLHTKNIASNLEIQHKQFHWLMESVIKMQTNHYVDTIEYLIKFTHLKELLADKKREALQNELLPYWKQIQKENSFVSVMHIHLADGTSFLRMHNPKAYGDSLAEIRPL